MKAKWLRYRTEIILFSLGALVFGGGLFRIIAANRGPANVSVDAPTTPDVVRPSVGPPAGQPVDEYIVEKQQLLEGRAASDPSGSASSVVSLDAYRSGEQIETLLRGRRLNLVALQVRVPRPGVQPQTVALRDRTPTEAVEAWRQDQSSRLAEELEELEKLIPTVTDSDFKTVYEADAELHRQALSALEAGSSFVYAILIQATHRELARISKLPGVRLVDIGADASATFETHEFVGIPP